MLIPFKLTHLPILQNWVDNEDILFQFSAHGFTFPLTEKQFIAYQATNPDRQFYLALDEKEQPYAFGEIIPQDEHSVRIARLLVGGKENRGKGLGLKLVHALLQEIKKRFGAIRVDLFVLEKNGAAIKCYQKAGFAFSKDAPFMLTHKGKEYPILKMSLIQMTDFIILHIIKKTDWEQAQKEGGYKPPSLATEGFIHCSTISQTVDTANLFYKGEQDLLLLSIQTNLLESPLIYEAPAGMPHDENRVGKFPHIYGHLNLGAVVKVTPFTMNVNKEFELPEGIEGD